MGWRSKALTAATAGACVVSIGGAAVAAHDRITTKITWDREIAPLFEARCAGCHAPGNPATFPLTTYQQARPWAVAIKEEVLARRMPKWSAARGYGDFANDPSLSPFEIALVAAWVDGGAPERDKDQRTGSAGAPPIAIAPFRPPRPADVRRATTACGDDLPIAGRLLAIAPRLDAGESAGVAVRLPDGRQEILAWIRNYDPKYPTTYWLRNAVMLPRGSRLVVEGGRGCAIEMTFAR